MELKRRPELDNQQVRGVVKALMHNEYGVAEELF